MRYQHKTSRYREGTPKQQELYYRQLLNEVWCQSEQPWLQCSAVWRPCVDILESPDTIRIRVELAGMKEDEIEITLYQDALVISDQRYLNQVHQDGWNYSEAQICYGPFRVEIFLPTPIVHDAVAARYEMGMLLVDLPRLPLPANTPERVPVQRSETEEKTF